MEEPTSWVRSYDDLKNMFDKGRYELAQGMRGVGDSIYLAPEYQNQSMDERQTAYLNQMQAGIELPDQQQERQQER